LSGFLLRMLESQFPVTIFQPRSHLHPRPIKISVGEIIRTKVIQGSFINSG
jgi:hypothetical protein